jgi:hypothetical protein
MSILHEMKWAALFLAMCGAALPAPAVAGTQYVIVASEPQADDFPAGRVLEVGEKIVIPQGTVLTLLGEDGSVNAIPGPAEIEITQDAVTTNNRSAGQSDPARSTLSKIASLLAGDRERAESLGVSRSFAGGATLDGLADPWTLSVHESAPACIKDGEVVFARKDGANAISLSFRIGNGETVKDVVWKSGEAKFPVNTAASPTDSEILVEAGKDFATLELHSMPDSIDLKNPLAVMGWMIDSGCDRQALAFVRSLGSQ